MFGRTPTCLLWIGVTGLLQIASCVGGPNASEDLNPQPLPPRSPAPGDSKNGGAQDVPATGAMGAADAAMDASADAKDGGDR
jgi:hypothetical protein